MKKLFYVLLVAVSCVIFSSCATEKLTRGIRYSNLYEEKPVTLLVMPPINNTTNVEAKEALYTSVSYPLAEAGYYVISPFMAMEILRNESAYDAENFINAPLGKFKEYFDADAVVFSVIDKWTKSGFSVKTDISYVVKSTITNEILFDRKCSLTLDLSSNSSDNSLIGTMMSLVVSAMKTAITEHIEAARMANSYIFNDIPRGKYSPDFMQDMEVPAKKKEVKEYVKQ